MNAWENSNSLLKNHSIILYVFLKNTVRVNMNIVNENISNSEMCTTFLIVEIVGFDMGIYNFPFTLVANLQFWVIGLLADVISFL